MESVFVGFAGLRVCLFPWKWNSDGGPGVSVRTGINLEVCYDSALEKEGVRNRSCILFGLVANDSACVLPFCRAMMINRAVGRVIAALIGNLNYQSIYECAESGSVVTSQRKIDIVAATCCLATSCEIPGMAACIAEPWLSGCASKL